MERIYPLFLIIILLSGCKKSESYLAWEKTYGTGEARYIKVTSDLGLIACGSSENHPYLVRLDENKMTLLDFSVDIPGVLTSAWSDTSGYITGGSTDGKMLLMRHSKTGSLLWNKIIDPGFNIDQTQLLRLGNGNFLAIGSASPDTTYDNLCGLLFLSIDSTGLVLNEQKYTNGFFIASYEAALDNSGNIYLALTHKEKLSEPAAAVAKFNSQYQLIWEEDLANNPAYGASATAIVHDGSGVVYVAGRTELPSENGLINNSFAVSISDAGSLSWKKYPESSNTGSAILLNSGGEVVLLNKNCFIVNILDPSSGDDGGRLRMFDECDPNSTDALAFDFDLTTDNEYVMAGSLGGNFYLAVRASQ
jgi:hypothetical protein